MADYYKVRNFEKFQHYKDRRPSWIKLHAALLDNYEFSHLPDTAKFHAIGLWLLASQTDNRLPGDIGWLSRKIGATSKIDLALLVESGVLERVPEPGQNASEPLADCQRFGVLEERREETEKRRGEARSRALPPDFDLDETRTAYAREQGVSNPVATFAHFRDHHTAKGTTFRDWDAAWRTWCRNEVKFARSAPNRADPKPHVSRPLSDADRARVEATQRALAERAAALSAPVSEDAKAKAAAFVADLAERKRMPR